MKNYLQLVPILAKAHKKQNTMTVLCIAVAVFLVAAIFGMADMYIRSQLIQACQDDGNWHIRLKGISQEQALLVAQRRDVEAISPYDILNYRGNDDCTMGGKPAAVMGSDEAMLTKIIENGMTQGRFPETPDEALVSENARKELSLAIGDTVSLNLPDGSSHQLTLTGFVGNTAGLLSGDYYGVSLTMEGLSRLNSLSATDAADRDDIYFVQFAGTMGIQNKIEGIKEQLGLSDEQVSENTKLMALLGQGSDSFILQIYGTAGVLFVLVLIAGVIMIASSLNSNVAGRTRFFGMLRCVGATKKQIKRLVRREALSWCLLALPMGLGASIVIIWLLCLILRLLSPDYFSAMPVLGLSPLSLLAGCVLGVLTVYFAAGAPAKRAAKVSPLAAVSGQWGEAEVSGEKASSTKLPIAAALGVRHAMQSKKNYLLMSASFALSIILFLSFTVTVDFMEHALTPMYPWTPDLTLSCASEDDLIPTSLVAQVKTDPAVERVYGRMAANDIPAHIEGLETVAHLISYEDTQFDWARDYLLEGSIRDVQNLSSTCMAVYSASGGVSLGSDVVLSIDGSEAVLTVAATLSRSPFSTDSGIILICSEDTLSQLSGINGFAVVDIQLRSSATDAQVDALRAQLGEGYSFADERMSNSSVKGAYWSFILFIYGFLALIGLVTAINIINSVALSVAARTRQYGVLRAVGLSGRQLSQMISAEAVTYSLTGAMIGTVAGLLLNRFLFASIVSSRWGDVWCLPINELAVILALVAVSVMLAVAGPIRHLKAMSILDTVSIR